MKKKTTIKATINLRTYNILADAVYSGVQYGLSRAKKHTATPSDDSITHEIEQAVLRELGEVIDWGDV